MAGSECCDGAVPNQIDDRTQASTTVTLCLEADAYRRLGPVLRFLIIGLVDQAFQVQVVSSAPGVSGIALGPVRAIIYPPLSWPFAARRTDQLLESLAEQSPQIVHSFSNESIELTTIIAQEFDADAVFTVTSLADIDALAQFDRPSSARVVALTEPLATQFQSRVRIAAESLEIIRPGLLVSDKIACFSFPERAPTILCATTLDQTAHVELLLHALALLHQREVNAQCFILGDGRAESSLRQLARTKNLSASVTFAQPAGDINNAFRNSDIFVDTSDDESFHVNTLRALAAGMCVVCVNKNVSDFIRDGQTAMVCPRSTPECLADLLQYLLDKREDARRIATGGAEYIRANHTISAMADATVNLYRKLSFVRTTFSIDQ